MGFTTILNRLGFRIDQGAWIVPGMVLLRSRPRSDRDLARLQEQGIRLLINLHEQPIERELLARFGLAEMHVPVPDFMPPTMAQIDTGLRGITEANARGKAVAIVCGAGLGRSGTLAACLLAGEGMRAESAISLVRARRPGAIETSGQVDAIRAYADRRAARERLVRIFGAREPEARLLRWYASGDEDTGRIAPKTLLGGRRRG